MRSATRGLIALAAVFVVTFRPSAQDHPPILKRQLTNGLSVWVVQYHDLPVVQISLVVPKGSGDDPPGRYGIASLTAALVAEGAGGRSAEQIAASVESLAGNLAASSGIDATTIEMHVPAARIGEALPLFADVVQRPAFPESELERVRQQRLATLNFAREDPDAIASLAFSRVVYGRSHRYGTSIIGTSDTLAAFTRADLIAFHESAFRPEGSTLIIAGDVMADDIVRLIETQFGKWRPAPSVGNSPRPPVTPQNAARRVVLVDKPDAPQSRIRIGGVSAPRSTSDLFAIEVLNRVLNRRLRSAVPSAGTGFDLRKMAGPFVAAAAVPTERTAEAVAALMSGLSSALEPVPDSELGRAKDDVRLPTFDDTGRISSRLQMFETLCIYGLPDDYYSTYVSSIRAVSASDVQRVARAYVQPDRLAVVVVGDLRNIAADVRALNLGSVEVMSVEAIIKN